MSCVHKTTFTAFKSTRTAMPGWQGERLDVGYAISVLHPLAAPEVGSEPPA